MMIVAREILGAELIDTLFLRPSLVYYSMALFGLVAGATIGSLAADAGFWTIALATRRLLGRRN
jgi:hypothetical protein